jgi:hypothetical protein
MLALPSLAERSHLLNQNRSRLAVETLIDGQPLCKFRATARREILDRSRDYLHAAGEPIPEIHGEGILLSGHQPELSHVGVWIKNFLLNRLAKEHHLVPLNLIVDNDTVKSTALRLPVWQPGIEPDELHLTSLPFDRFSGEVAYEHRQILEPETFDSFPKRLAEVSRNWPFEPLLPSVWESVQRHRSRTENLGELLVRTRREWERRWGCHNLELPLSHLCQTESFRRFARHLLNDLPRFHAIYNRAVEEYRRVNRIRSRNHPVPNLAQEGDWLEAPFWVLQPREQRRGRLMVRGHGEQQEYRLGDTQLQGEWSLRTRALTTTMFSRVALGDLFIHGIGGAKYDEVTDEIIRQWLGIEPPDYLVATATLRLPFPTFPITSEQVKSTQHHLRDRYWNPQRYLKPEDPLVIEKIQLISNEPQEKTERKEWYRKLSALTAQLREREQTSHTSEEAQLHEEMIALEANRQLQRRDFAWALFPEDRLKEFLLSSER